MQCPIGSLPIHAASNNGHTEVIIELLKAKPDLINLPINDGSTPLILATKYGHYDAVVELVNKGAIIDLKNIKGDTARTLSKNIHPEIFKFLSDPNSTPSTTPSSTGVSKGITPSRPSPVNQQ